MIIALTPCTSSNLESHGYDVISKTLAVKFKDGPTWHYFDVPQATYEAMKAAKPVGGYSGSQIKGKFRGEPQ